MRISEMRYTKILLALAAFLCLFGASSATYSSRRRYLLWRYWRSIVRSNAAGASDDGDGSDDTGCPEEYELVGEECLRMVEDRRGV